MLANLPPLAGRPIWPYKNANRRRVIAIGPNYNLWVRPYICGWKEGLARLGAHQKPIEPGQDWGGLRGPAHCPLPTPLIAALIEINVEEMDGSGGGDGRSPEWHGMGGVM